MLAKYFREVFAIDGDRAPLPDEAQASGAVSYEEGYGIDYQTPLGTADARAIERAIFNQLMFDLTRALQEYQQKGIPDFILPQQNGGVPFPYEEFAIVRFTDATGANDGLYISLINNNTRPVTDTAAWVALRGGADSQTLRGLAPDIFATPRTIAQRGADGELRAANLISFAQARGVANNGHVVVRNPANGTLEYSGDFRAYRNLIDAQEQLPEENRRRITYGAAPPATITGQEGDIYLYINTVVPA